MRRLTPIQADSAIALPAALCFRVTRYCNARCGFCLAPPDGAHPPAALLMQRLDWLLQRGVRRFNFCGGEPTIHPALAALLAHVHARGARSLLTTNGIALPAGLPAALRATGTQVKISLHGDAAHHDAVLGRPAFHLATQHLREMRDAGIATGVQTTLTGGAEWVLPWMIEFCLAERVRQLNLLPFIARGSGAQTQDRYGLAPRQRSQWHEQVRGLRHALRGRLELRWLDFSRKAVPVVEADGRIVLERASEAQDTVLCTIPGAVLLHKPIRLPISPSRAPQPASPGRPALAR